MRTRDGVLLENLSYDQVESFIGQGYAVFIPIGSLEQHGKHMPCSLYGYPAGAVILATGGDGCACASWWPYPYA